MDFIQGVKQTQGSSNALQCCIATLLNYSLDIKIDNYCDLPDFINDPDGLDYETSLTNALKKFGLGYIKIPLKNEMLPYKCSPNTPCVIRGNSPRGSFGHVVVGFVGDNGLNITNMFDPHPDNTFLAPGTLKWALFLVPHKVFSIRKE